MVENLTHARIAELRRLIHPQHNYVSIRRETLEALLDEIAIPSCDRLLLAFAMTLAQRYGWTTERVCEFLAEPWAYQKEWGEWLRVTREDHG